MLKSVTLNQHGTIVRWDNWIVSVPDNMDDERIEEVMRDLLDTGVLELNEEEYEDEFNSPSIEISEAPSASVKPDFTLTEDGIVDENMMLTAFTTERLQAELDRRRAKESELIVA
jgi:hypothetical protein